MKNSVPLQKLIELRTEVRGYLEMLGDPSTDLIVCDNDFIEVQAKLAELCGYEGELPLGF